MSFLERLPAEIFRQIEDQLCYVDALSLKSASRYLYSQVQTPSIRSYLKDIEQGNVTRARSLKVLTEEGLIPRRGASCRLCLRILTFYAFNKG